MKPWFKLYGIEMISDPKYQRLNAGERSCWITLLCLGMMDDGVVKHCEEHYLISHSGIDIHEMGKYHGILMKFEMLGLVTKHRDEMGVEYIKIKNWGKRQEVYSESYERVKKHREIKKKEIVTDVTLQSNVRVDKSRVDKNRREEIIVYSPEKEFFMQDNPEPKDDYPLQGQELVKFHRYWSEKDQKGKMRWQKEKTFELKRRMVTWRERAQGSVFNKQAPRTHKIS